jgi:hypothetical protein
MAWLCCEISQVGIKLLQDRGLKALSKKLGLSSLDESKYVIPIKTHVNGISIDPIMSNGPYFFVEDGALPKGKLRSSKYVEMSCTTDDNSIKEWRRRWKETVYYSTFKKGQIVKATYGEFKGFFGVYNGQVEEGVSEVIHETCMGPVIKFHIPTVSLTLYQVPKASTLIEIDPSVIDSIMGQPNVYFPYLMARANVVYGDAPETLTNDEVTVYA